MNELIEKISSYNLFNYLFPGFIFAVVGTEVTSYSFMQEDLFVSLFIYYFYGLIVSRLGSLVFEPLLLKVKYIKYAKYSDYIKAEFADSKLPVLLEQNNSYRTLSTLFVLIILLKLVDLISSKYENFGDLQNELAIIILAILFLASFRKQTNYIKNRVNNAIEPGSGHE